MNDKAVSTAAIVIGSVAMAALLMTAKEGSQQWHMSRARRVGLVRFTVETWRPGSHNSIGNDVSLDDFRGLGNQLDHGGRAKFTYLQDAGTLECTGNFSWSRGSGSFTFVPNPAFRAELERLGYSRPDDQDLFDMMMTGVGVDFARAVKDAGLNASMRQLIDLRNHGVDGEFIGEARKAGYTDLRAQDYINLRNHGVGNEFLSQLRSAGYDLRSERIVELANHGIDSRYIRELRDYGLQPGAEDLVQLKNHGVSPEFVRDTKALGYDFSTEDLIELRNHGVDAPYLRRLRDSGLRPLTAQQIEKLKVHGVD